MAKKFDKSAFLGVFKEETLEHLGKLEKGLLYLEKNPQDEKLLEEMMRQAHTLKGSSMMMGYKRIAELAHKFEDCLLEIKKAQIKPKDAHFDLLLEVLDSIKPLLEDKLTWPDKGVDYPHVPELEKKIDRAFGLKAEKPEVKEKKPEIKAGVSLLGAGERVRSEAEPPRRGRTAELEETAESIRVKVEKVDQLMNLSGELVVGKIRIEQRKKDLENFLPRIQDLSLKKEFDYLLEEFSRTADEVGVVTTQLQESVMGVRMLPIEVILRNFPRLVRDLAKEENKEIEFALGGEETELDKTVLEKIQDPLMHILRNCVSHGIEPAEERKKIGKPETGRIDLRAYYKGSQVIIEVEDDGRGIDAGKVKELAVKKGILSPEEINAMSDNQVLYLLFLPGMSTEKEVSRVSGRGVGLNVVKTNITELKGIIEISSVPGQGAKFTIKLPLTLAVTQALFVKANNQTFAIALDNIEETLRITQDEIKSIERREAISIGDEIIPLIRLADVLGLKSEVRSQKPEVRDEKKHIPIVIVKAAEKKLAILVDELVGKLEVVAKSLGDHLRRIRFIAGATILGTGEAVLILDIPNLLQEGSSLPGLVRSVEAAGEKAQARRSVLVVEDSLITRDLEKSILEAAGYQVGLAKDGLEALAKLSEEKFELVLTDIAMSGMDGFTMLKKMKEDEKLKSIPVVIVSAKDSEEDKRRGLELGASAYITKSEFDQVQLLETIERLVG